MLRHCYTENILYISADFYMSSVGDCNREWALKRRCRQAFAVPYRPHHKAPLALVKEMQMQPAADVGFHVAYVFSRTRLSSNMGYVGRDDMSDGNRRKKSTNYPWFKSRQP
jgi:hypothetical protein